MGIRCDTLTIASHPLHAEKARAYLERMRPDLAERLRPASDWRPGEAPLVKLVTAVRRERARRAVLGRAGHTGAPRLRLGSEGGDE